MQQDLGVARPGTSASDRAHLGTCALAGRIWRERATAIAVTIACVAFAGCGGESATTAATSPSSSFCETMAAAIGLLDPEPAGTTVDERRRHFDRLASVLADAERTAPPELREDVASFAAAIERYRGALADVDFDLDALFATPAGAQLAEGTSHGLSPAVIGYLTGPCGLTPNNGEERAP